MQESLRLRHAGDFQRLRRVGQVYRHHALILSVASNNLTHNRYGFITAKYLGNAVRRNRIRRQLREAIRLLHPGLYPGRDMVFIVRPALIGQPFQMIQRIVYELCEKANMVEKEL